MASKYSKFLLIALLVQITKFSPSLQQDSGVQPDGAQAGAAASIPNSNATDETQKWEEFKKSSLYLPSFDPKVISIPKAQSDFSNEAVKKDLELYRQILREAIDKKNNFAPSVGLMLKYSGKLISHFIRNRKLELQIKPRLEPKPTFFEMLARLAETVIDKSTKIKKEKGYNKKTVNSEELYHRVDSLFNYVQSIIRASPVAAYLQWDELILYKNDPTNPNHGKDLIEEAADLAAVSG